MNRPKRAVAGNLVLLLATVLVFFGAVEVILRLSGRVPTDSLRSPDLATLDGQPGLFEANQDFVDRMLPALPYRVRTNGLGFRGAPFDRVKPAGTLRILCVGDSYTLGPYVADEQTMPGVLHERLRRSGAPAAEVVNGGVNGFTILDELTFLRDKALGIDPDIVVVAFSQNDIRDLGQPRATIDLMRDHAGTKSRVLIGPGVRFLQRTALFNAMQRTAAWLKVRRRQTSAQGPKGDDTALWARYEELLKELAGLLSLRNVKLLLVAWPSARQISGEDPLAPQERLDAIVRRASVEFLDLTPVIRSLEANGIKGFLVPLDGHPTAASYDAAAEAVAGRLEMLGWRERSHSEAR